MEVANRIVAEILEGVKEKVQPGIETRELDELAEEMCRQRQVQPAFKGYRGYPRSICVSVNEEVVHGIPGPRRLKAGDLVSLDFGVKYDGYYGDAAITVGVGEVGAKARALMEATEKSLYAGIAEVKAGNRLSDISHAVQARGGRRRVRGHPGVCGARHRPVAPRRPADPQFRPAGPGADLAGGHDVCH